ncbi:hypothetical protein C2869_20575 [Saccharobesus litoralis]|uniref:Phospholipid transport system substrate-binding protein n=1 Tax=Saccharobesus litoralis TaxID=2172099 RepID=A0A2S0VWU0_9ALTE|nr:ABC transporter substrate-binding protein [Saccharobesus litoralis]AWB68642.1 hypothetical protein C2869_20575 [Saccharobesus litoralis]
MNLVKIKKYVALTFVFVCIGISSMAQAAMEADPYILLKNVAQSAFNRFDKELDTIKQNPDHLKVIVSEELLPHIDYTYASYKVLGNKHFRKLSTEQKREFVQVFKDYMVTVYAQVFSTYRQTQSVAVEPSKDFSNLNIVVVKSKIIEPGRPDIDLYFKFRKREDKNTGAISWRAYDMDAEGISVLDTKRKEINEAIKRSGIKAVIADLKSKAEKPLVLKQQDTQ